MLGLCLQHPLFLFGAAYVTGIDVAAGRDWTQMLCSLPGIHPATDGAVAAITRTTTQSK